MAQYYELCEEREKYHSEALFASLEYVLTEKEEHKDQALSAYANYIDARLKIRKHDQEELEKQRKAPVVFDRAEIDAILRAVEGDDPVESPQESNIKSKKKKE